MKRIRLVLAVVAAMAMMVAGSAGTAFANTLPAQATEGLKTGAERFVTTPGYGASGGPVDHIQCGDQLDENGNPLPDQNCDNDPSEPA